MVPHARARFSDIPSVDHAHKNEFLSKSVRAEREREEAVCVFVRMYACMYMQYIFVGIYTDII